MTVLIALNTLRNASGSKSARKRVGRGIGCTKGKTCGKGVKGQKARAGVAIKGFEGGQMPLIKRLPKRGFNPLKRFSYTVVSIEDINYLVEEEYITTSHLIDKDLIKAMGIIKSVNTKVKLLGGCELLTSLNFALDAYSLSAKRSIESSGSAIIVM